MAKSVHTSMPGGAPDGWDAVRTVILSNRYGLHMRPSKQVVELANEFPCDIVLVSDGQEVDAKSILGLIGLGAECGSPVEIKARGEQSAEICGLLETLPELHGEPRDIEGGPPMAMGAPPAVAPRDPAATDGKGRKRSGKGKRGGDNSSTGGSRS